MRWGITGCSAAFEFDVDSREIVECQHCCFGERFQSGAAVWALGVKAEPLRVVVQLFKGCHLSKVARSC